MADLKGESNIDDADAALSIGLETARIVRRQRRSGLDLAAEFRSLEVFDQRSVTEILCFGDNGLPI
jgi:hypothetical protein